MARNEDPYPKFQDSGSRKLQESGPQPAAYQNHGTKNGKDGETQEAYWNQGSDQFSGTGGQWQQPQFGAPVKQPPRKTGYDLDMLVAEHQADRAYYDNSNCSPFERFQNQPFSEIAWSTFAAGQPRKQHHSNTETRGRL